MTSVLEESSMAEHEDQLTSNTSTQLIRNILYRDRRSPSHSHRDHGRRGIREPRPLNPVVALLIATLKPRW